MRHPQTLACRPQFENCVACLTIDFSIHTTNRNTRIYDTTSVRIELTCSMNWSDCDHIPYPLGLDIAAVLYLLIFTRDVN
jgi:hypothetical protein